MKIVVGTCPSEEDKHGVRSLPPLSLAYILTDILKIPGVTAKILDSYGEDLDAEETARRALAEQPDILALGATSHDFRSGLKVVRQVKAARPATITVMGGYHPTAFDELLLRQAPELDYILRGEADHSLARLAKAVKEGTPVTDVPGLSYRQNGDIVRGVPQQVEDLDSLAIPDRDLMDYGGYFQQFGGFAIPKTPPVTTMITSRGCPHHCVFCPKLFPEWKYRWRSAESVFEEVLYLYEKGYRLLFFQDENFSHNIERLETLCRMIIKQRLKMRFLFQGTLHHIPDSVFRLMHQAGIDLVFVGIETGSDDQLRRYRKPTSRKTIGRGVSKAKKHHMAVIGFFIFGGVGETWRDIGKTNDFVQTYRPHVCGGSSLTVHANSPLWHGLVDTSKQVTIDDTLPRRLVEFPGQLDPDQLKFQRKSFERAYRRSWLSLGRIYDVLDLLVHNRTVRSGFLQYLTRPNDILQVLGRKSNRKNGK